MPFDASREGQLDEKGLGWGYWWVTHKVQVRKIFTGFLIALDVVLVAYPAYGFVDWFFLSGVKERAETALMTKQWIDYVGFHERTAPKQLVVENTFVLPAGASAFDAAARMTNPNPLWRAEFDYHFEYASGATPTQRGYILPGTYRWVAALGVQSPARPSAAQLVVENLQWRRVDQHDTRPDYASWAASRLSLQVTDAKYVPPTPQDAVPVGRATFTVTNATAFGYYNVGFFVVLYSGQRVTGVNRVAVSQVRAGEVRQVEASWFSDIPSATRVEVVPEVNIFDTRAYIPSGG